MDINIINLEGWSLQETKGIIKIIHRGKKVYQGFAQEVNILRGCLYVDGCPIYRVTATVNDG